MSAGSGSGSSTGRPRHCAAGTPAARAAGPPRTCCPGLPRRCLRGNSRARLRREARAGRAGSGAPLVGRGTRRFAAAHRQPGPPEPRWRRAGCPAPARARPWQEGSRRPRRLPVCRVRPSATRTGSATLRRPRPCRSPAVHMSRGGTPEASQSGLPDLARRGRPVVELPASPAARRTVRRPCVPACANSTSRLPAGPAHQPAEPEDRVALPDPAPAVHRAGRAAHRDIGGARRDLPAHSRRVVVPVLRCGRRTRPAAVSRPRVRTVLDRLTGVVLIAIGVRVAFDRS